jgi:hypothetical protein
MAISLSEVIQLLLTGKAVTWAKFDSMKAGSIRLDSAEARRLFAFLLKSDPTHVNEANEKLFPNLIAAWKENTDPADDLVIPKSGSAKESWRLHRIEANNFGGLNSYEGPNFDLEVNGENWCLEGQNGSGKTSIASAVIWALTGFRCREQDGIFREGGQRLPILNDSGAKIGEWPPIISLPSTAAKLNTAAEAWVRLTFKNNNNETATAYRKIMSPTVGEATIEAKVDSRLLAEPQLIETGLLMPGRLAKIGFGERSQSIYDAVKLLTGLDHLSTVGEGAANLCHANKRFLKYATDNGIKQIETSLQNHLDRAVEEAKKAHYDLKITKKREEKDYAQHLREISQDCLAQAAQHLTTLTADISSDLDINTAGDRNKIKNAVSTARGLLAQGVRGIEIFEAWVALHAAATDPNLAKARTAVLEGKKNLRKAIKWDERQASDSKLRLKALASRYFKNAEHQHVDPNCPLCESKLSSPDQRKLAQELAELRDASEEAERRLVDACNLIESSIRQAMPQGLAKHMELLAEMQPRQGFRQAATERFASQPPFSDVLIGIAEFTKTKTNAIHDTLPEFSYSAEEIPQQDAKPVVASLQKKISEAERIFALAEWWSKNRDAFRNAWSDLCGKSDEQGEFPLESIEGKLASLEGALEKAVPLDELAKALNGAAKQADSWHVIYLGQIEREQIANTLEPLKDLRALVLVETASSISSLSARIKTILDRIHFRERLSFEDASLAKKAVDVMGSFSHGVRIDASSVANASWLRALLWAFTLALREQAIENKGSNSFPLMVLDDPQTTFDQRNKRNWAREIVGLANRNTAHKEAAQLLLTTHERQFFQFVVNQERLTGQQGFVVRLCDIRGVATVINGTWLTRCYDEAIATDNDEIGHSYVLRVRTYCEDLLKIMLRVEKSDVPDLDLGELAKLLKSRHDGSVSPFNRPPFTTLLKTITGGGGGKSMTLINDAHHKYDGTIGVAAAKEVKVFWEDVLQHQLHNCFKLFVQFEAYNGEPRLFPWMESSVQLPTGTAKDIATAAFSYTGIAAAAKTDGRVGDGLITIKALQAAQPVKLHNHEVYQLAAGTLEPVAGIGDTLIVSNYAPIHARNLTVSSFENRLIARRYNESEVHPHIVIFTAQSTDPYALSQPIIAAKEMISPKKIVGTLFTSAVMGIPPNDPKSEFVSISDTTKITNLLRDAKLFKVEGRSAEPIALDGQYLITQDLLYDHTTISKLDGKLVIAIDESGARYFKRLRARHGFVILESLNPDGTASAEILSIGPNKEIPILSGLIEVVGVLFELPA